MSGSYWEHGRVVSISILSVAITSLFVTHSRVLFTKKMVSFSLAIALPKFKVVAEAEADTFPSFLPKDVNRIKDPFARSLATRVQRLPVSVTFFVFSISASLFLWKCIRIVKCFCAAVIFSFIIMQVISWLRKLPDV